MSTKLIPAGQFRVQRIDSLRIKLDANRTVMIGGFMILDLLANQLVSLNDRVEDTPMPTTFSKAGIAEACISQGLYEGYGLVPYDRKP